MNSTSRSALWLSYNAPFLAFILERKKNATVR